MRKLSTQNITGILLTTLLVAQFFVIPIIPTITGSGSSISPYYAYAHVIFSYCAITAILLLEFKDLDTYHIDQLTLWLFVFSCVIRTRLGVNGELHILVLFLLIGTLILITMLKHRSSIPRTNKSGLFGGLIVACLTLGAVTFVESLQASNWLDPGFSAYPALSFFRLLIYQLSFVILIEEIVFRGFLVGYLHKIGLNKNTALIIQALLYWLIHYMRFGNFLTFFVSIPILAFSTGIAIKRYKQLSASITIHIFVNVLLMLLLNALF